MNSKQYYETVDVGTAGFPEKEGRYFVEHESGAKSDAYFNTALNKFISSNIDLEGAIVAWIRPVNLSELMGKVWDDAVKWRTDMIGDAWMNKGYDDWNRMAQDEKITYINSLIK